MDCLVVELTAAMHQDALFLIFIFLRVDKAFTVGKIILVRLALTAR